MVTLEILKAKEIEPLAKELINREINEVVQAELTLKQKAKRLIEELGKARFAVREKVNKATESTKRPRETGCHTEWAAKLTTKTKNDMKPEIESTAKIINPSLYESEIRIVTSGSNSNQVNKLENSLGLIEGLQLLLIGGSVEGCTEFVVSTDKPILLINTLKEMLFIDQVKDNGEIIQVTMKT